MHDALPEQSILARIEAGGGKAPRVALRDIDETTPASDQKILHRSGRYEILGEIASGGVGTIRRARDIDLGRDVAIKVLHDKHLDNPELVQRLIEEAQISGQLQHPAIVPVYEIGMDDRNVPFIAMKLVKGETLTALLQARADAGDNQRQFLSYFQRTCSAMAYAHARGVIHRDLKPSNLMVGSYGEVMILDWGFAKVLARGGIADELRASMYRDDVTRIETVRTAEGAESVQGSIMGTPAYMPPEQALGNIDDLDKRSDVFSLGAILCEILTGIPPYGDDIHEVLNRSVRGDVEEAYRRLDACGADDGLVSICKSCLNPLRKDRPKDAGVLAGVLDRHLTEIEERVRKLELAALNERKRAAKAKADATALRAAAHAARTAAAEQRAAAEKARDEARYARDAAAQTRRSRKQVLAIAAAAILVVALGGGGYVVNRNLHQTRVRELHEQLTAALDKAQRLRTDGQLGPAIVAAHQALDTARRGDGDTDPVLLAQAEELAASLEKAKTAREEAAAKRERERALGRALEAARARRGAIFDSAATDRRYAEAFQRNGIGLERGEQSAADLVRECLDPAPVIGGLDEWAWFRHTRVPDEDWGGPLRIANLADDDAWRHEVREAVLSRKTDDVRRLAAGEQALRSGDDARLVGMALVLVGRTDEAVAFLRRAQLQHAGDAGLLGLLSYHLSLDPHAREAATRCATSLVTLRPDVVEFRLELADVERQAGDLTAAVRDCRAALAIENETPEGHALLADLLERTGQHAEALPVWQEARKLDPQSGRIRARLGLALLRGGNASSALTECDAAAKLQPKNPGIQVALAKASLAMNNLSGARAACNAALSVDPKSADAYRTLALVFLAAGQADEAVRHIEEAAQLEPNDPFVRNTLGLVRLQRDEAAAAQAAFTQAAGAEQAPRAAAWANLGAMWLARNDLKAAINACREAIAAAPVEPAGPWYEGFTSSGKSPLDQSIDVLRGVIERNAAYAYAYHRLGVALEKKGQFLDAIRACKEALALEPDYGYCIQTLAWIYANCPLVTYRNADEALALAKRLWAIGSHPRVEAAQILGIASYRAGDFQAAATALQGSVQIQGGGDAWDWYFLAMARWKLGNEKTARRWLAKAQAWTDENAPKEPTLRKFREEAEALIPAER